jgi:hypothetical protein
MFCYVFLKGELRAIAVPGSPYLVEKAGAWCLVESQVLSAWLKKQVLGQKTYAW